MSGDVSKAASGSPGQGGIDRGIIISESCAGGELRFCSLWLRPRSCRKVNRTLGDLLQSRVGAVVKVKLCVSKYQYSSRVLYSRGSVSMLRCGSADCRIDCKYVGLYVAYCRTRGLYAAHSHLALSYLQWLARIATLISPSHLCRILLYGRPSQGLPLLDTQSRIRCKYNSEKSTIHHDIAMASGRGRIASREEGRYLQKKGFSSLNRNGSKERSNHNKSTAIREAAIELRVGPIL